MKETIRRDIAVLLLLAGGLFLTLIFFSYSPFDPTVTPFLNYPLNTLPQNLGGILGAYLAGISLNLFGFSAFLLPLAMMVFAVQRYRNTVRISLLRVGFLFLAVITAGGLLALPSLQTDSGTFFPPWFRSFSPGGVVGLVLADHSRSFLGAVGSGLFLGTGLLIFFAVAFALPVLPLFRLRRPVFDINKRRKRSVSVPAARVEPLPEGSEKEPGREPAAVTDTSPAGTTAFKIPEPGILSKSSETEKPAFDMASYQRVIKDTIADFGIAVELVACNQGPTVTMFELELPPGVMPQRITSLSDNLAMALLATSVRVVAPLPGKSTVGLEVPNPQLSTVYLSEIIAASEFVKHRSRLALAMGKNTLGQPLVADLRLMPHLLVAGATGSGKTICINSLLLSLLYRATPEEVQLLLIDPKKVELTAYQDIPHLLLPVITETRDAIDALKWLTAEMDQRYRLFSQNNVRNIEIYNSRNVEKIPYIVVVVDELADLITLARVEVEGSIVRIAALARAAGIHLVIATQRPSVNVVTGIIKANLPARIAFQVSSKVDSRTIIDINGAEKLLGRGDMLYLAPGSMHPVRAQGCYLSEEDIEKTCEFLKTQGKGPTYDLDSITRKAENGNGSDDEEDPLYREAVNVILNHQIASISLLQRKLKIGFNRAARLIEEMEQRGIVGPYQEGKPRQILKR